MQITQSTTGNLLELTIRGRLDNDSAGDLNNAVDEILRKGRHTAVVDLRQVEYMSSAGLGALIRAHKRFRAVQGTFGVKAASSSVEEVIRLSGLAELLLCSPAELNVRTSSMPSTMLLPASMVTDSSGLQIDRYDLEPEARMTCRIWGDAARLTSGVGKRPSSYAVPFSQNVLGLGIGALGNDFADCEGRFGELLGVAGNVAVQPTPAGGKPDYQVTTGDFIPRPHLLYGVSCEGNFAHMIRFTPEGDVAKVRFSTLVEQCLAHSDTQAAAMVFVVETAGLIGAALRRSPALGNDAKPSFAFPEIRRWLSFAPEHVHQHSLAVVVGIAVAGSPTGETAALEPLVRPLARDSQIRGHFHAAVFSYRPLKKRSLNFQTTVDGLFEGEDLRAVLHLLNDERSISGGGESEMVGGACWVGPLGQIATAEGA